MVRYILAIALATHLFAASAEEAVAKELPRDQEAAAIQSAETKGLTIYQHDHAAAVASDAAMQVPAFKVDKRVQGWLTEEQQGQIVVTFIDQSPSALYRVIVSKDGVAGAVTALESPAQLTAYESAAATARATALAAKFEPCSERYNPVMLHSADASAETWVVYLLPGTAKNNTVPIGGTYRIETIGTTVASQRGFTRTCIALQTDPRAADVFISHLLDPTPTEAHVYWSLWVKKPMYVATSANGTIWVVDGNKIRLVERKAAKD